jgi:hypothetical protein
MTSPANILPGRSFESFKAARRMASLPSVQLAGALTLAMLTILAATLVKSELAFVGMFLLIFAILAYATKNLFVSCALVFAYYALEGMFKYLSNFSIIVYAIRPAVTILLLLGWVYVARLRGAKIAIPPMGAIIGAFAVWGFLECFNPEGLNFGQSFATLWVWYLAAPSLYILLYNLIIARSNSSPLSNIARIESFAYVIAGASAVVSAFAVLQFKMGIVWTAHHLPGYDTTHQVAWFVQSATGQLVAQSWKPASTTSQPGGGAFWAYMGATVSLGLLFSPKVPLSRKAWIGLGLLFDAMCVWVSGVRLFTVLLVILFPVFIFMGSMTMKDLIRSMGVFVALALIVAIGVFQTESISGGILSKRYAATLNNPIGQLEHDRGANFAFLPKVLAAYPYGVGFHRGASDWQDRSDKGSDVPGNTFQATNRETELNAIADDEGMPGVVLMLGFFLYVVFGFYTAVTRLRSPHLRFIASALYISLLGEVIGGILAGPVMQDAVFFWVPAALLASIPVVERQWRVTSERKARAAETIEREMVTA